MVARLQLALGMSGHLPIVCSIVASWHSNQGDILQTAALWIQRFRQGTAPGRGGGGCLAKLGAAAPWLSCSSSCR